ncbi:hypothetical protein RJT34_08484 [Clitoria ternatea]|uniref:Peptidylprolyl isomerase n=1 Tax=Clitoria ternatea TaxID=43366 RepID=A0AAN9K5V2_CLITE
MGFTRQVYAGLDHGIITMKKREVALFILPVEFGGGGISDKSNSVVLFEVELVSWITVVDIYEDGGVLKKIMEKGSGNERPTDLDEVLGILVVPMHMFFLFIS